MVLGIAMQTQACAIVQQVRRVYLLSFSLDLQLNANSWRTARANACV